MGYSWGFSELKRGEGGAGVDYAVRAVNRAKIDGVKARRDESPFVGHEAITISARTKAGLRRALGAVKRSGLVSGPVSDLMRWAHER